MRIEMDRQDAELLRDMLQRAIAELDRGINRTDSLGYKRDLQQTDRAMERVLGRITAALDAPSTPVDQRSEPDVVARLRRSGD